MPLPLSLTEVAFARTPCRTRLPFRFGAVTVTSADLLTCRVRCAAGADTASGYAADLLVPRWFRKDTDATPQQDADELLQCARSAAETFAARLRAPDALFAAWRDVFASCTGDAPDAPDRLARGFGVALVERALLDAASRLACLPFATALREDVFGFRPGEVHGELAGWDWRAALPTPSPRLLVRHTVGMLDVLRTGDLAPGQRLDDGLPQTLEQDLAVYGHRWLKVKIGAGPERDRARLLDLAAFLGERDLAPGITLDGNEQYPDTAQLAELLEAVAAEPRGRELLARVAWIEQPLARAFTFDRVRHADVARVTKFAPLILDEADSGPDSFRRALDLGYRGVSVKNCKGVFRALANFGLCRAAPGRFQSSEDLTNIGVLPLQQDLVTAAVLGLPHSERNGHHYFRGLDHLGPDAAAAAARDHADLYGPIAGGDFGLRITGGEVSFASALSAVGYGHAGGEIAAAWSPVAG
ncbi:MAG: mandelate racemase [Planctomycetes bacterium]|nr:mandelate racemase [Planctomycetota bacterium]MCB9887791.1 mandelate racemase [Planctomycetota bacterium]